MIYRASRVSSKFQTVLLKSIICLSLTYIPLSQSARTLHSKLISVKMSRSNSHSSESSLFLEPPHSHNPTDISHVCALPRSMMEQLPESVQNALWSLQESTSVVFASYSRLQSLIDERFDRLVPLTAVNAKSRKCK
jgi:hypothetical protein